MSCPISTGRRSPGSRIAQPLARARWTHSDARGAHRHVERLRARGRRGVEHHQRRRVELRHEPALEHLAAAGHGRPVDARGRASPRGRRAARRSRARRSTASSRRPGAARARRRSRRAPAPAPPPPGAITGSTRGSTSTSPSRSPTSSRSHMRSGSRITSRAGLEHAAAAAREADVDPHAPRPAPGDRHRPAEQRLDQLAAGRRQQARRAAPPAADRARPPRRAAGRDARDCRAARGQRDPRGRARGERHSATPGT